MWTYVKHLEYPVRIKTPNPAAAKVILDALGGADGELSASMRYLTQRFGMPNDQIVGILTDVGTEELAHVEIVSAMIAQLMKGATVEQIKCAGAEGYFTMHTTGVYPSSPTGEPHTAAYLQSKGDVFADIHEDLAAEGTIVKEQPVFSIPEKALFHVGFRTFRVLAKNRRLRPHKNNKSQKYDRTSCFQKNTPDTA